MPNRLDYNTTRSDEGKKRREAEREMIERLVRDRGLRERMLPTVAGEQNNRCANPIKTCEYVTDGKATSMCQWGDKPVPPDAQQLDHIVPFSQTQDNSRENLQMLCACCHAMKTALERRGHLVSEIPGELSEPEELNWDAFDQF
jgi:5-methylcytosine-specific restriction endonuclease McrA